MMAPVGVCPARVDLLPADNGSVGRLLDRLARIWPEGVDRADQSLGLAVSGGPDSCALLLLAASALPGRIAAATVDHGLRPESSAEAQFVADLCAVLHIDHTVLPVSVGSGNIQSQARAARYRALAKWVEKSGLAALATAHHADDQAETLLLRLARASGVAGLAGVRERGRVADLEIPVLRPLLDWRRTELERIVSEAGVQAVADPSNLDDRFDRVRLRKAIAGADWIDPLSLAQSAAHLADADDALEWAARREWDESVRNHLSGLVYRRKAPRAVALRVLGRLVSELGGSEPRGGQVARVLDSLESGNPASIGTLIARPKADGWYFSAAERPRKS